MLSAGEASAAAPPSDSAPKQAQTSAAESPMPTPPVVVDPDRSLAPGWRESKDRAVVTVGDANGLHVLVADGSAAYAWRAVATLRQEGLETDRWIGNACVTSSGRQAFVTYAPREFTNTPELSDRGGFNAVVDLETGQTRQLPARSTLDYYSPGCGNGESAILTQSRFNENSKTRLLSIDGSTGAQSAEVVVQGQVTSAVPTPGGIVAARAGELLAVAPSGTLTRIADTKGSAFRLHPDAQGGVAYLETAGAKNVVAKRWTEQSTQVLAEGTLGELSLSPGSAGRVFLTGKAKTSHLLPPQVSRLDVDPTAVLSTEGRLAVTRAVPSTVDEASGQVLPTAAAGEPGPALVDATVTGTGKTVAFQVDPAAPASGPGPTHNGGAPLDAARGSLTTTPEHDPVDVVRTCALPRNDVNTQIYQPTPNQVEWAVDLAVRNLLNDTNALRLSQWKQAGMGAAWSPQNLFPSKPLAGPAAAGKRVPAQIMLGILAQESNMWQASKHTLPGQYGNPLIGNFYGINMYDQNTANDWDINWTKSDCGYGIGQVTDDMTLTGQSQLTPFQKRALTVDYASNIARSLQILQDKWNELHNLGTPLTVNNDDPSRIENWYLALWNYNLGFNAPTTPGAPWGMGWLNNPANPKYPADRTPFLDNNHYADAAKPQNWAYQEKVLGWSAWPIDTGRSYNDSGVQDNGNTHGYSAAWWTASTERGSVSAPWDWLCDPQVNNCDPDAIPQCPDEACYKGLWWTKPIVWKPDCTGCGNETMTYKTKLTEPGDAQLKINPSCDKNVLPPGARIVDDVPDGTPIYNCGKNWAGSGTFEFTFPQDTNGQYTAKVDLQQLGNVGFGSHTWFGHSRTTQTSNSTDEQKAERLKISGTWRLAAPTNAWTRIMVHAPSSGAHTQQAAYHINAPGDPVRIVPTRYRADTWINLGVFDLTAVAAPSVTLSTDLLDGTGDDDVAWDAVAFVPLPQKPTDFVVAMGDSYSSGEGAENYYVASDNNYGNRDWNACRRSKNAYIRQTALPGTTVSLGQRADTRDPGLDFAFVACSGATVEDMEYNNQGNVWLNPGTFVQSYLEGQFREVAQLKSGFLDSNTTLVTLSIGGNDAGFPDTLKKCVIHDCSQDSEEIREHIDRAVNPEEPGGTNDLLDTEKLIRDIHTKAPNAKIALVGYPEIFNRTAECPKALIQGLEAPMLSDAAGYLAGKQQALTELLSALGGPAIPVFHVNPITRFTGHRLCDSNGEWLNSIVVGPQSEGDFSKGPSCMFSMPGDDFCVSRESFHPKKAGTTGYARVLEEYLAVFYTP